MDDVFSPNLIYKRFCSLFDKRLMTMGPDNEVLVYAVALCRGQELRVHKVNSHLGKATINQN